MRRPETLVSPSHLGKNIVTNYKTWDHADRLSIIDPRSDSPLWMVTNEPTLNELVMRLQRLRFELLEEGQASQELVFSRVRLERARSAFSNMIRYGERDLHHLSELLCSTFLNAYQRDSIVIGEIEANKERFTLSQQISREDLYTSTDIDLGTRQLEKFRFKVDDQWSQASLVANLVDYQPTEPNPFSIHRLSTRIKAEEEIWNKVTDEIFDLDNIVVRDKELRHLSRYVKDIFGIKIVVGETDDIRRVHGALLELMWPDEVLLKYDIQPTEARRQLEFVEVKDYLNRPRRKKSGWEAIKSVVRWSDKTFEIQVQSLRNFLRERERLTKESHRSFKANRERVRNQVAQQIPLFGFYRELLRWLFLFPDTPPPEHSRVTLRLVD